MYVGWGGEVAWGACACAFACVYIYVCVYGTYMFGNMCVTVCVYTIVLLFVGKF